jgi:hypothetical protein
LKLRWQLLLRPLFLCLSLCNNLPSHHGAVRSLRYRPLFLFLPLPLPLPLSLHQPLPLGSIYHQISVQGKMVVVVVVEAVAMVVVVVAEVMVEDHLDIHRHLDHGESRNN